MSRLLYQLGYAAVNFLLLLFKKRVKRFILKNSISGFFLFLNFGDRPLYFLSTYIITWGQTSTSIPAPAKGRHCFSDRYARETGTTALQSHSPAAQYAVAFQ